MTATMPTELELLQEARKIALTVGAVVNGDNFFETETSRAREYDVGVSTSEAAIAYEEGKLCGVCVLGARRLAEIVLTGKEGEFSWRSDVELAATDALRNRCYFPDAPSEYHRDGWFYKNTLTEKITELGSDYVVEVIDQMIRQVERRERVFA